MILIGAAETSVLHKNENHSLPIQTLLVCTVPLDFIGSLSSSNSKLYIPIYGKTRKAVKYLSEMAAD